jgi:RNA polymerase sigma-B factor
VSARVRPARAKRTAGRVLALQDDRQLALSYQRDRNRAALEELVRRYLPLARTLAARYRYTSEPFDDLVQVAGAALVAGTHRFDAGRGQSLRAFAVLTMLGELRRHFRDIGWSVHVARSLQERARRVREAVDALSARAGRSPSVAEVAAEIGATREEVVEALEVRASFGVASHDLRNDDEAWSRDRIGGVEDPGFDLVVDRLCLAPGLRALPARERTIVELRFGHELSQSEIGRRLGISQMHVSRLLRRALRRMEAVLMAE